MPFTHRSDLKPYQRDDFEETIVFERWAEQMETSQPPKERNMITLKLLTALIAVESSGNDKAIGDKGKSHGCLQISEKAMIDINQERRKKGLSEFKFPDDCYDREKSKIMFHTYMDRYWTEKRLQNLEGRGRTLEDAARIWNGGPYGFRMKATEAYWAKVKTELEK